jgi:hypothetical protein
MNKLKVLFALTFIFSLFSAPVFSSVGVITKETNSHIVSVLTNGTILTSSGTKFHVSSSDLLKKAAKLKNILVKITYYQREGEKYCQDIQKTDSGVNDSINGSQKIIIEKQLNKRSLL